ncbi:hypothetical protein HK097_000549 [Rhizophlyctis rosea]|uniref:Uncharacterized protein n=1 Tax=Rhizophlyctis rosea TaxID=64517 RepID=A0AAD5SMQ7_9FUNG|nr:hypothetical protein HK097_000549 [Rhizophlyctis rosea]
MISRSDKILAVKLYKYCVELVTPRDTFYRPFISHIAEDLLESASVHATYRFSIFVKGEEQPFLLLWLLNWNALLGTNHRQASDAIDERTDSIHLHPAMKGLYLDCNEPSTSPEIRANLIESFMEDKQQVEELKFHEAFCVELLAGLRRSGRLLPKEQRRRGEGDLWRVGVLERGVV